MDGTEWRMALLKKGWELYDWRGNCWAWGNCHRRPTKIHTTVYNSSKTHTSSIKHALSLFLSMYTCSVYECVPFIIERQRGSHKISGWHPYTRNTELLSSSDRIGPGPTWARAHLDRGPFGPGPIWPGPCGSGPPPMVHFVTSGESTLS